MAKKGASPKKGQKSVDVDEQTGEMKDAPRGNIIKLTQHHEKFIASKMALNTKPDKAEELRNLSSDEVEDYVREKAKLKSKVDAGEYDEQVDLLVDMVRHPENYPCENEEK